MFKLESQSFGLDISNLSLKIIELEKGGEELKLSSFGEAKIPQGVIEKGEVKKVESLAQIIKKGLKKIKGKRIKTKYVVSSLPEEKSFLDVLQIPIMKEEEIEKAVRFEAENHIPLKLDEVYFDFEKIQPISKREKYQEILIAATPKDIVDPYFKALVQAGLRPLALEIESLAIVRALIKKDTLSGPLLIIDFGETRTSFIIFSGRSLRFTSTIPISSQALTETISKNLKITPKKAEKLKKEEGLEGKKEVFEAMIPALTDLSEQIKIYLKYYRSHASKNQILHNGKKLERILLCGGGANLKGLIGFLSSTLKVKVELGNPWVNILKEKVKEVPELPFEKSLAYTTALGLALRGVRKNAQ